MAFGIKVDCTNGVPHTDAYAGVFGTECKSEKDESASWVSHALHALQTQLGIAPVGLVLTGATGAAASVATAAEVADASSGHKSLQAMAALAFSTLRLFGASERADDAGSQPKPTPWAVEQSPPFIESPDRKREGNEGQVSTQPLASAANDNADEAGQAEPTDAADEAAAPSSEEDFPAHDASAEQVREYLLQTYGIDIDQLTDHANAYWRGYKGATKTQRVFLPGGDAKAMAVEAALGEMAERMEQRSKSALWDAHDRLEAYMTTVDDWRTHRFDLLEAAIDTLSLIAWMPAVICNGQCDPSQLRPPRSTSELLRSIAAKGNPAREAADQLIDNGAEALASTAAAIAAEVSTHAERFTRDELQSLLDFYAAALQALRDRNLLQPQQGEPN